MRRRRGAFQPSLLEGDRIGYLLRPDAFLLNARGAPDLDASQPSDLDASSSIMVNLI